VPERQTKFIVRAEKMVESVVSKVAVAAKPNRCNAKGGKYNADDD